MKSTARLTFPGKPDSDVELNKETTIIGRSRESDVMLVDPYISRKQSVISSAQGTYSIRNVGRNPIQVNGRTVQEAVLQDGDSILIGSTELRFHQQPAAGLQETTSEEEAEPEDKPWPGEGTVFLAAQPSDRTGPHLILSSQDQDPERIDLVQDTLSIGRSPEADLSLSDPSVSRQHCEIARKTQGFVINNRSRTNPVLVNAHPVSSRRLFSGDQIRIGAHTLSFISDRDEDQRPAEASQSRTMPTPHIAAAFILAALVLILGVYFVVSEVIQPWRISQDLAQGRELVDSGRHRQAIQALEDLLQKDLQKPQDQEARSLLAKASNMAADELIEQGRPEQAESLLTSFIQVYGSGADAEPVQNRLDELRLHRAQNLEDSKEYQKSLGLYASIRQNGPFADQARNGIRRIWLAFQQIRYERYAIIDPDNAVINSRIQSCRSRTGSPDKQPRPASQAAAAPSENAEYQKQVQEMLQESGADSSRIMKYLFEDESGEKGSPW